MNELKVDDGGITPMEKFSCTITYITLKITTYGTVQFIYWMQDCKAT